MDVLDIARWQFGLITVYHFLFVPITIGLSAIVAGFETAWLRTERAEYLRLTKFFGKLFLINFALGVVTGIVQEFQFGMNWSDYSRFVGDVFGAPLAIEGLAAFFLESTFIGLWIFGWDRLPRALHAACIWIVHLGTLLSAYFILAANSWMQHPVGYRFNEQTGKAELTDFWAVMTNPTQLVTFPHVVTACYLTGGAFVAGVALWLLVRRSTPDTDRAMYRNALRIGAVVMIVGGLGVAVTGDIQGKIMTEQQPMKMSAAEAQYETRQPASFSVFTIGSLNGSQEVFSIRIPRLLSFLATGSFDGKVEGVNDLRVQYEKTYGEDPGAAYYSPDGYTPIIPVTYWSFRLMIGLGMAAATAGVVLLWLTRRGRRLVDTRWAWVAIAVPLAADVANSFGWIFTEMGRQPWVVFGVMTTAHGVSPGVSVGEALTSILTLAVIYAILMVVELGLLLKTIRAGAEPFEEPPDPRFTDDDADRPLAFAY
ncbi:MAG: cytochrome ubiquinol oxidase subunit I [Propionibacteriales bacterium]|nr:cytochrome ubiquinol oxidase subunit I [Propionibacteriales bacterium]